MTRVVNIYKDEYDFYIGRPGKGLDGFFGNPKPLKSEKDREANIAQYREYFFDRLRSDPVFKERVLQLKGSRLGCFCMSLHGPLKLCHGMIIVEYLEGTSPYQQVIHYRSQHGQSMDEILKELV